MQFRRKLSREEAGRYAQEMLEYQAKWFELYERCKEPEYSEEFKRKMEEVLLEEKTGKIRAAEHFMGWQCYIERGLAAVMIFFLLICVMLPETVQAGYHKFAEVVEVMYEEYREYRYRIYGEAMEGFEEVRIVKLPEGMEETRRQEIRNGIDLLYENGEGKYFNIYQKKLEEEHVITYYLDTEDMVSKKVKIKGEEVELEVRDEEIFFVWKREGYCVGGQTNLEKREVIKILNQIEW